jgi:Leucine-rich repeat (LRR) protein
MNTEEIVTSRDIYTLTKVVRAGQIPIAGFLVPTCANGCMYSVTNKEALSDLICKITIWRDRYVSTQRVIFSNTLSLVINSFLNSFNPQLSDAVAMYEFIEFISVRRNQLAGTLPEELFASSTLKSIDLYDNNIFGEIPSFDPSIPLQTLHMGSNNLSGKIYPSIANAKSLARLDLSSNTLNGELPAVLFDLPLEELSLHTNLFSGVIPTDIGKTTSLVKLDVGNNGFGGELPVEMGSLSNLEELMIRNVPQLTGRIPASYGLLFRNLLKIVISETGINGNIPETFGSISNLETIDFSKNFFRGDLPSELGNLVNLKTLDLFDNDISGTIPAEFGNMTALEELLLEDNNISGDIPSQLGRLENLRSLSLQDNSMGGRAPDEVCSLRSEGLDVFVVDCPERDGGDSVLGIICRIPDCCTDCK